MNANLEKVLNELKKQKEEQEDKIVIVITEDELINFTINFLISYIIFIFFVTLVISILDFRLLRKWEAINRQQLVNNNAAKE